MPALALFCMLCFGAQDSVRVTATLSSSRIGVGDATTLQLVIETHGDAAPEIRMPVMPLELEVRGTSDFTQTQFAMPGGRSRLTRREVVLVALRAGVFRIAPVIVRVGGRVYRTQPLEVVVEDRAPLPRSGIAPSPGAGPRLSLLLEPDTVFVGQQILLNAEVLFADDFRMRQTRPPSFDPPAPTDFWIQDLPNPVTVALRVMEGRTVEIQTYRRAYFPLSAGEFTFPPARLHYEVRRGFLNAPESRQIESDPARIIVLPLPAEGRPASFNGAVGRLSMKAGLAPDRVSIGDAAMLYIEVEGQGNVKALPEPMLPFIEHIDVLSPAQESRVEVRDDRVGGVKRFRWVVVPEQAGTFVIPPIEYAYFDPAERRYQVLRTDTLRLVAVPIAHEEAVAALRPLREAAGGDTLGWVMSPGFLLLQTVPLLGVFALMGVRRRRSRPPAPRVIRAAVIDSLRDVARTARDDAAFLGGLERALLRGARDLLATYEPPQAVLRERGADDIAGKMDLLVAELRTLRYAPGAIFNRGRLLRDAIALIEAMPMAPRPGGGGRGPGSAAAICLALAAVVDAGAALASDARNIDPWEEGRAAWTDGDAVAAAAAFREHLRTRPRDAAAWYNYGLAAHAAGDPGRAVWAWLRAARLAPRDGDVAHNLTVLGADLALDAVRPLDRLTRAERTLILAVGWWLLAGAAALTLAGRRRGRWIGIAGVALVLVAAAGFLAQAMRDPVIVPLGTAAPLLASPTERAEPLGQLHAGGHAFLQERRGDYLRVRLPDTGEAWVERRAVASP